MKQSSQFDPSTHKNTYTLKPTGRLGRNSVQCQVGKIKKKI